MRSLITFLYSCLVNANESKHPDRTGSRKSVVHRALDRHPPLGRLATQISLKGCPYGDLDQFLLTRLAPEIVDMGVDGVNGEPQVLRGEGHRAFVNDRLEDVDFVLSWLRGWVLQVSLLPWESIFATKRRKRRKRDTGIYRLRFALSVCLTAFSALAAAKRQAGVPRHSCFATRGNPGREHGKYLRREADFNMD